jgi:glycosyltransferase involved in cell wall biosynthesis
MRVCYFGTYRADYARNEMMIEGLRRNGVEVVEIQESLWHGIEDRVDVASGGWRKPSFWWRVLRTYGKLLRRYRHAGEYDILIVGYPGQMDVFLARLLSWWRHTPLVWDVFMSIYLIAVERGLAAQSRCGIRLLRRLEWLACRLPNLLILDTDEYVAWFESTHGLRAGRFRLVPTGADDRMFHPFPDSEPATEFFHVLYYGTFIPNHGVEYMVEAARLLIDAEDVRFELIGDGPEKPKAQAKAQRYDLVNVEFTDWLERGELLRRIAGADLCLGVFGTTPQSLMTVHNKIYEGLAAARPVLTGDGPAVRRLLAHGEHVYLCPRANPEALADAIRLLRSDSELRRKLAENGHHLFTEQFDLAHNGHRYVTHLRECLWPGRQGAS